MAEVLTWECPKCGKIMHSFYQKQIDQWKKQHLATHEKDARKNKEPKKC